MRQEEFGGEPVVEIALCPGGQAEPQQRRALPGEGADRQGQVLRRFRLVDPGDPRPLVVIDPGHGGIDTGAKAPGNGGDEKTMVLNFALALRDHLEKSGKYRVALTRSDDTFIPLNERVRIARALKASLFVSIHADYLPKAEGEAKGATVYTLSEKASDAAAGCSRRRQG